MGVVKYRCIHVRDDLLISRIWSHAALLESLRPSQMQPEVAQMQPEVAQSEFVMPLPG